MKAQARVDVATPIGVIDRRLFGSFVEHLGRCVYTGIYEPGHPTADAEGFRGDVIELAKELGVTTIRYPGGNFVSSYKWEDGVGPRESRPTRLELAWHSTETNEFGLLEFTSWLEKLGAEPMLAVNSGTRGVEAALDMLEYCVIDSGTALSDSRAAHGRRQPIPATMWCLGNEMDGPWQLGHMSADDYGKLAATMAHAMKLLEPDLELVVCGSSSASMPTFGTWERTVLGHTFDHVDFISCHAYYEEYDGDLASFLASPVDMDHFIETVAAIADEVAQEKGSEKRIQISFDEWNVWYLSRYASTQQIRGIGNWPVAPRLLEDNYSVADAVVVGGLLISLLSHADRVKSASLAQLVNVIGPIMTEPGGPAWRQATFFPFATTARLAKGVAVEVALDVATTDTARHGTVALVDAVATVDAEASRAAVFLVNRSLTEAVEVTVGFDGLGLGSVVEAHTLADEDHYAKNSLEQPERVGLKPNPSATVVGGTLTVTLPPISWTAVQLSTT